MASPVPKAPAKRQRRNRHSTAAMVEARPAARPDLPADYHELTRTWWSTIWSSPISGEWVDADVPGLVMLAQLVEDYWRAPRTERPKAHAEVRMASREYGLSPMSRRSLQWEVRRLEAERPPSPPRTRSGGTLSILSGKAG